MAIITYIKRHTVIIITKQNLNSFATSAKLTITLVVLTVAVSIFKLSFILSK